jgi:rare lipoprotein A (peptidoglycan hydrolase)
MVSRKLIDLSVEAAKNLGVDEDGVSYHHRIFVERDSRYNDKYLIVVNGGA